MGTKSGRRKPERKPILSTKEYQEILDSIRKQIEVGNTAEADVQTRALRLLEHIVSERAKASDSEGRKSAQIGQPITMQYDLNKYGTAFALLGANYKTQVPDFVRRAMIFVALNLDYTANANRGAVQDIFGSNSGFALDDGDVQNCLNEIKRIG